MPTSKSKQNGALAVPESGGESTVGEATARVGLKGMPMGLGEERGLRSSSCKPIRRRVWSSMACCSSAACCSSSFLLSSISLALLECCSILAPDSMHHHCSTLNTNSSTEIAADIEMAYRDGADPRSLWRLTRWRNPASHLAAAASCRATAE